MIGAPSLILESMPALLSLFALGYGVVRAVKRESGGFPLLALGAVMCSLIGVRYVYQWRAHAFLSSLSATSLRALHIGPTRIDDARALERVVSALREAQWFSANHGGWDTEVELRFEGRDAPVRLRAAIYQREEGAVISLSRGGGFSDGYVFCPILPAVLAESGVPLPGRRWVSAYEGQGFHAWYDPATVKHDGSRRSAWAKLHKQKWTAATVVHIECAAQRIRYAASPGIAPHWSNELVVRPDSVSAGLARALCGGTTSQR